MSNLTVGEGPEGLVRVQRRVMRRRWWRPRYRIVRDNYCGYEVQIWRWYWPFWRELGFCNTHTSFEDAERFARHHDNEVVAYL